MFRWLTIFLLVSLTGCSYFVSTDELSRQIEQQMQHEFDLNPNYRQYHLRIQNIKVLERKGLSFKAQATLQYDGQPYTVLVEIYKDLQGYAWKIDEEQFAFIDEAEIAKYQAQLDQELNHLVEELEQPTEEVEPVTSAPESYVGLREEEDPSDYQWTGYDDEPFPKGNITVNSH